MTSCQTTRIPKEWEGRGEMTIRTISKPHTGGVTKRRDQPEWTNDGRSVSLRFLTTRGADGINHRRSDCAQNCVVFLDELSYFELLIRNCFGAHLGFDGNYPFLGRRMGIRGFLLVH